MASALIEQIKACTKCGEVKPANTEYFVRKLGGLTAQCKPCLQAAKRAAWAAKADEINADRRSRRNDETRALDRERYARNPERRRRNVAGWRKANPEKRKEIDRKHYQKFADIKKRQARQWAEQNKERRRENMRRWTRVKRESDPVYRLKSSISAYLYWCLKHGKNGKRTDEVLGYTISDLKRHLERQFLKGMSWDNYGEWHVDHIIPVSSFRFEGIDDPAFKTCWALANLRPLWAADNIRKSDKRLFLL